MSLQSAFISQVRETDTDFELKEKEDIFKFHQVKDGNLKFIYTGELYKPSKRISEYENSMLSLRFSPIAIVKGMEIYTYNNSDLGYSTSRLILDYIDSRYSGVYKFEDKKKEICKELITNVIPVILEEYIKDTEKTYPMEDWEKENYTKQARQEVLWGENLDCDFLCDTISLRNQDFIDILQGKNPKDLVKEIFSAKELFNNYAKDYTFKKYYNSLLQNPENLAEAWEFRLAETCKDSSIKNVVAEFEVNDKRAEGKMSVERIKNLLLYNNTTDIDDWSFITRPEGKKVCKALGLDYNNRMYISDLVSLKYRGKTIYQRD